MSTESASILGAGAAETYRITSRNSFVLHVQTLIVE